MGFLTDWLTDWLKELLIEGIMGNLTGLFDTVNSRVGEIAVQVGTTPAAWNAGVFSLIRQLSETVILPIAGLILTFVATYELIQLIIEKNNLHDLDYYRKHRTLEGCPELTAEQVEKVKASMSQDWRKDPVPFPSYLLTNNNANIRRVRQRIEELSHKTEFVGWTFPGGEAKVNEAENRLQLIFADKPDADTRQALKSEGFKWAPSQGAWQRQLNQNAIRAAARLDFLRPEDGKSPYQLQPFAKRAEKDVSR